MSDIVELNSKRAPVVYTVTIAHHYDGTLEFNIADVAEDERSRESVMSAFRRISGADKEIDILRKDLRGAILSNSDYVKEIDCQNTRLRADLAAVTAERARLREALEFYGWAEHWVKQPYERSVIEEDKGRRARAALKGVD